MTVPDEAVEAAARAFRDTHYMGDALMAALAAVAPFIAAQATADVAALIDEAESRPGSSMYCKVTTYELRKALGQDVTGWPKRSTA